MSEAARVTIYTDGGCQPNPGPGGWACILQFPNQAPQEYAGAEADTTNNRMELQAAIEALSLLSQPHQIEFYTDSQYLRRGVTEWLAKWQARNWRGSKNEAIQNQDLWQFLSNLLESHEISWHWVKGHAGNKWNERADELASAQIPKAILPLDDQNAIHLFTAAAYSGKEKRGAWAIMLRYREHEKTLSGQVKNSSANQMHLQSALEGLKSIKKQLPIHLYTFSDYLNDGANRWVKGWKARGWQTKTGKGVSHQSLWQAIDQYMQTYEIHWHRISKDDAPEAMLRVKDLASAANRNP